MKLIVIFSMVYGSQATTSLFSQAPEFAEDQAQSRQNHTNLVSMDSHVQEILVWGCFSINLLSPRAQQYKKQYLASQHKEDKGILERVQQWATMMIKRCSICHTRKG